MGPGTGDLIKIGAFVLAVAFAMFLIWLKVRDPKPRERMPVLPRPRDVMPTEDDIEPVDASVAALPPKPAAQGEAIEQIAQPQSNGQARCRLCKMPIVDADLIEFEDWQQITGSRWGRWLAWRERRVALEPGREFHARRGLCRSCAAIGHQADREEQARLESLVASERRVWEQKGRDDAILRRIAHAEFRYAEQRDEQLRADTRMRARASEFLDE